MVRSKLNVIFWEGFPNRMAEIAQIKEDQERMDIKFEIDKPIPLDAPFIQWVKKGITER